MTSPHRFRANGGRPDAAIAVERLLPDPICSFVFLHSASENAMGKRKQDEPASGDESDSDRVCFARPSPAPRPRLAVLLHHSQAQSQSPTRPHRRARPRPDGSRIGHARRLWCVPSSPPLLHSSSLPSHSLQETLCRPPRPSPRRSLQETRVPFLHSAHRLPNHKQRSLLHI